MIDVKKDVSETQKEANAIDKIVYSYFFRNPIS